jgi:CheY-like chemotaxis protein
MPQASTDESTATLRVLVVDDCAALRHRVRAALERAGLSVVGEAADGAQALAQAARSTQTWCSWISTCRAWTASRPP